MNENLLTNPQARQCGGRGLNAHADTTCLDDGTGQADTENSAAQRGDHGQLLLEYSVSR